MWIQQEGNIFEKQYSFKKQYGYVDIHGLLMSSDTAIRGSGAVVQIVKVG